MAYANVTCEGVKFSHICVLQGKDKMFVSFPQIKTEIGYKDIVYFSTAGLREQVTNKVLKECQKLLEKTETPDFKKNFRRSLRKDDADLLFGGIFCTDHRFTARRFEMR